MIGIGILLLAALVQAAAAATTDPSIDFHFTYEAVLQRGAAAATTEWTARCVAGGEFADVAGGYAPDPRARADERTVQAAKFDRQDATSWAGWPA